MLVLAPTGAESTADQSEYGFPVPRSGKPTEQLEARGRVYAGVCVPEITCAASEACCLRSMMSVVASSTAADVALLCCRCFQQQIAVSVSHPHTRASVRTSTK